MMVVEKSGLAQKIRESMQRAASRLGVEAEETAIQELIEYAIELERWNRAYNLVGRKIGTDGLVALLVDAVTPLCVKGLFGDVTEVLDIGSGAGLPGIPIYLLAGPFPLTLVESQRKKITFLRHVRRKLELERVVIFPERLESASRQEDYLNTFEVALARAVMDPMRLIKIAEPLICEGGRLVIYVGKGDAERIRKGVVILRDRGMKLEALRSTQRFVGRENFLAVVRKTCR